MKHKGITIYAIILSIIGFLLALQMYLMARLWFFLPLLIILPFTFYYVVDVWYTKYIQKKKGAIILRYAFIGVHFTPLVLQVIRVISPGIDNIILALIGFILYYVSSSR